MEKSYVPYTNIWLIIQKILQGEKGCRIITNFLYVINGQPMALKRFECIRKALCTSWVNYLLMFFFQLTKQKSVLYDLGG